MNPDERINYLEVGKAVLDTPPATKAIDATKAIEAVWKAGGLLVISDTSVRAVRVPLGVGRCASKHGAEILRLLHRQGPRPGGGRVEI